MTRITRAAAVLAAAALLPLLLGAPAGAESLTKTDPADATASPTDIRKVKVNHADRKVYVRIKFADLATGMDNGTSSASIYFDTKRRKAGPEYVMGIPLFEGGDWAVSRTDGWKPVGDPIHCRSQLRLVPEQDLAKLWVRRGCLDKPAKVRVSVKMTDWFDGSHVVRDWVPARKTFTRWLARG